MKKKTLKLGKIRIIFAIVVCAMFVLCGCSNNTYVNDDEAIIKQNEIRQDDIDGASESAEPSSNDTDTEDIYDNYDNNAYYEIIETASYKNSIGDTILIHKVLAKKDASISANVIAYSANGDVIGKSSDDITLTKGENNFFRYYFENDISNVTLDAHANVVEDFLSNGERDGVEMVKYNVSNDDLYVTFRQTVDELSYFAKFKLLFYKGDQIIETEDGHFSIYAENLNGKDSTDVAEIWIYGIDFDRIEYIFEP